MKGFIFIFFSFIPASVFAQYIGLGYQYADFKTHQFVTTASVPLKIPDKNGGFFLASGLEYLSKGTPVSGLNFKALSASKSYEVGAKHGIWLIQPGLDSGYLFGMEHSKDGIVFSPNIHVDFNLLFHFRMGYDYNISTGNGQFFIRLAVGFGAGWMIMKGF